MTSAFLGSVGFRRTFFNEVPYSPNIRSKWRILTRLDKLRTSISVSGSTEDSLE
jgi:hypothetical protein